MPGDYTANSLATAKDLNVNPTLQADRLQAGSLDVKLNSFSSATTNNNTDIVWRNSSTGNNVAWVMNGTTISSTSSIQSVSDPNWNIVGTGDFNNDGKTDILWRNSATGEDVVWLMNGTTFSSSVDILAVPDKNWNIVGTGDFNNDGKTDILWRNSATGEDVVWFMNGTSLSSSVDISAIHDKNWNIVGTGDFNNDGKTDILWRNSTTSEDAVWLMNGTTLSSAVDTLAVSDKNWNIVGTGDFNNDGKTDILWRNSATGEDVAWLMNGTTFSSSVDILAVPDKNWNLVGTGNFHAVSSNQPPRGLQFNIDKTSYNVGDAIALSNGVVYDAQGASNLSRVHLRVQPNGGSWQDIADVTNLTVDSSDNHWANFTYSLTGLTAGNYILDAIAYDTSGSASNEFQKNFSVLVPSQPPVNLLFTTNKPSYNIGDTLSLVNGTVSDSAGVTDLSRVHFKLQKDGGSFQDLGDVTSFSPDSNNPNLLHFDYNLSLQTSGNYVLDAIGYNRSGTASNEFQKKFSVVVTGTPGSTINTALNLGTLISTDIFSDSLSTTNYDDYYQFTLANNGTLNLTLNNLKDFAQMQLVWDKNGNGVQDSGENLFDTNGGAGSTPSINTVLQAGTYYIHVYTNSDRSTPYTLSVSTTPTPATTPSDPGQDLSTALDIGNLTGTRTYSNFVGYTDTDDYYKVSLANNGTFDAVLTNLKNLAQIELIKDLNGNGLVEPNEVLFSTTGNTGDSPSIHTVLQAGTYYIHIDNYYKTSPDDNTTYSLSLSTTPTPATTPSDPGQDVSTALDIGNLTGTRTYSNFVGYTDTDDYYKVSLANNGTFDAVLSTLKNVAQIELIEDLNGNGLVEPNEVLFSTTGNVGDSPSIHTVLQAGTYFIHIDNYDKTNKNYNTTYSLSLSTTPTPATTPSDPGQDLNTALDIGNLTGTHTYSNFVGYTNSDDYYKVSLANNGTFDAVLTNLKNVAQIELIKDLNGNGLVEPNEVLFSTTGNVGDSPSIHTVLQAGTYFIHIDNYDKTNKNYNTTYSLSLSTTPTPATTPSDPGQDLNTALDIGNLTGTHTYSNFVGYTDSDDYYRFNLVNSGTLNLNLSNLKNGASMELIQDKNGNGLVEPGEVLFLQGGNANNTASINTTLQAGTYYIHIYNNHNNNDNTTYTLSASIT